MDQPNPNLDCPSCGYSLTSLTHTTCPECGKSFAVISTEELNRRRRWFKPFALGMMAAPALYLCFYLFLRVSSVYQSGYSMGSWEVELDSNSEIVDTLYLPLAYFEMEIQFHFTWFHDEPSGC